MTKGTTSRGKRNKQVHHRCRRCGKHSYHAQHGVCAACGYGSTSKTRGYTWAKEH
jgi:large subunit ribosomal protein L37e